MQVKELAEKEILKAIIADEQANACYYQILKRFACGNLIQPALKLDSTGLKKIDTAWTKIHDTNNLLRRAYMRLYRASL